LANFCTMATKGFRIFGIFFFGVCIWQMFPKIHKNLSNFCNHKIENENPAQSDLIIQGAGHKYDAYHHWHLTSPALSTYWVFFSNIETWLVTTHYCMQETWGKVKLELSSLWRDILL
jgi:hypothetical protein